MIAQLASNGLRQSARYNKETKPVSYKLRGIAFSKDRALQLDGTLASFYLHCQDPDSANLVVLFKASSPQHAQQYEKLKKDYPKVTFIPESSFRTQLLSLVDSQFVLFLVDDNIFVRPFALRPAVDTLAQIKEALGFSLRLGKNTNYCYSLNSQQEVPEFVTFADGKDPIMGIWWLGASHDFAYPLEVSSSIFRSSDIRPLLESNQFKNPNSLEGMLASKASLFQHSMPILLTWEQSATFCNPVNKVQQEAPENRAGISISYSADDLAARFDAGERIDVASYSGFTPNACHHEVEIRLCQRESRVVVKDQPRVALVIPCYKQAHLLPDAVKSIAQQTYPHWECTIVNDGSPDNTSEVARQLIAAHGPRFRLFEKENQGLAAARNSGLSTMRGDFILPVDSDDMIAPRYIESALEIYRNYPDTTAVTTNVQCFGAKSEILQVMPFSPQGLLVENMLIYATCYRWELWARAGGYRPTIPYGAEDYNFWVTSLPVLKPRHIQEPMFWYRKHPNASMVDAVISHQQEVYACLHTIHPECYPAHQLLGDHEVLSNMKDETFSAISKIAGKFPQYPELYLWLGLYVESKGNTTEARRYFIKAAELSRPDDWQAWFRLTLLEAENGSPSMAREAAQETLRRCPSFPLRPQLERLETVLPSQ